MTDPPGPDPRSAAEEPSETASGPPRYARPGFWAVLLGVGAAVLGGIMMKDYASPVWMVLLFAGLVLFGFGLVLGQREL